MSNQLHEHYEMTFGTDSGSVALADLMDHCHLMIASHIPGDPYETAFRDGQREVALYIMQMLSTSSGGRGFVAEVIDEILQPARAPAVQEFTDTP